MMHRRHLLGTALTLGTASVLEGESTRAAEQQRLPAKMIDTNVSLFQWPFRRLPLDQTERLVKKLTSLGITQARAGSFEGLLHRDLTAVNERLVNACRRHSELIPVGSINPTLPGWEGDLQQCIGRHRMRLIRLHPNYHGYGLNDPRFAQLLQQATSARCLVQIAVAMEDTRTQHPMMQVPDVDLAPLPEVVRKITHANVQLLNYRPKSNEWPKLTETPGIFFDMARVDGTDGIAKLIRDTATDRMMFGTHAPFLIPEAALIRVFESGLTEQEVQSLMWKTAGQLNS